jgi:hypothetical protein
MVLISDALLFLQFLNVQVLLARQRTNTFVKFAKDASINATPTIQVEKIPDAMLCAVRCIENDECKFFAHNSAIDGQCKLFAQNINEMPVVFVKNWIIFAIQGDLFEIFFFSVKIMKRVERVLFFWESRLIFTRIDV